MQRLPVVCRSGYKTSCMQRKLVLPACLLLLLTAACRKYNTEETGSDSSLTGKWRLSEFYMDPGDGSGTWQPAGVLPNTVYAEFKPGGKFQADASFFSGYNRYTVISDSTLWLINSMNKDTVPVLYKIVFKTLTLRPPCIEGCGYKFNRVF